MSIRLLLVLLLGQIPALANAASHEIVLNANCNGRAIVSCAEKILTALEAAYGIKLHADTPTDIVHGHVNTVASGANYTVTVTFYESDEPPNAKHKTTFAAVPSVPSRANVQARLRAVPLP